MESIALLALVVAFAYILLYLRSRYYLREGFNKDDSESCYTVLDTSKDGNKPYVTNEDKYGDYEQDIVYKNEGGFDPTRNAIDMARRKFPFDWAQLPPSSGHFQEQQALFVKDSTSTASPYTKETGETIEAKKLHPPDEYQEDTLKAYKP
jgi:hypothetical protein